MKKAIVVLCLMVMALAGALTYLVVGNQGLKVKETEPKLMSVEQVFLRDGEYYVVVNGNMLYKYGTAYETAEFLTEHTPNTWGAKEDCTFVEIANGIVKEYEVTKEKGIVFG